MKIIIPTLFLLISLSVVADFKTIAADEMQAKVKEGVVIIDVRRQDEYDKYGIIAGSHQLTFFDQQGNYNLNQWLTNFSQIVPTKNTPFILVCAHANRTKTIARFLDRKAMYQHIFELDGGIIDGWINQGLATTKLPANSAKRWYQFW